MIAISAAIQDCIFLSLITILSTALQPRPATCMHAAVWRWWRWQQNFALSCLISKRFLGTRFLISGGLTKFKQTFVIMLKGAFCAFCESDREILLTPLVVVGQNNKLCWLLNTGAALSDAGTCLEYDSGPGSHTWCQLISVGQWSVVPPHLLIPAQAQTSSWSPFTSHRRVHSLDEDCICCVLSPALCLARCCHSSVMSLHYRRLPTGGWVQPPRPLSLTSYASLFPGAWVKLYWLYNFTVLDSR